METSAEERKVITNFQLWFQFIKTTFNNIRKAKINYCLGFFACFIVVFVVSILVTLLSQSPLIFLRLSELDNGEMDVMVKAGGWSGFSYLNYTYIETAILPDEPFNSHTPRRVNSVTIYFGSECSDRDPNEVSWKYKPLGTDDYCSSGSKNCFEKHCPSTQRQVSLLMLNSEKEKKIGFGRDWPLPSLQIGECYVHNGIKRGLSVNDIIYVAIKSSQLVGSAIWEETTGVHAHAEPYIYIPFKVAGTYTDAQGKHRTSETDIVMVEYDLFIPHLIKHLDPDVYDDNAIQNITKHIDMNYFADRVVINFPSPRTERYMSSNYDTVQGNVIKFANQLFYKLGFVKLETSLPILEGLSKTKIISLFLGLILNIIIFILLFLSILLIYSLLMINVETRTFELGVMRMVGTTRNGVIMLLLIQAFFYAIPASLLGLIFAELGAYVLSIAMSSSVGIQLPSQITLEGFLWGTFLGMVVPVVSAILPIRSALGQNLHDSLDTRASKTVAVKVKLDRSDPTQSVSWDLVLVGSLLGVFGGMIYYLLPLALLAANYGLLLNVFFFLLIGMLLGLTMLSLNLQRLLEKLVLQSFFFWENAAVRSIVSKNMMAHRVRNRKTTIMYAISLGFIIFVSIAASLQISTFEYRQQQSKGCFMRVQNDNVDLILNNAKNSLEVC
eukprot:TRINITY_DN6288_c0_g1_i1.p1 TRINITY_DN6288_c0_g1~~TRINITY_DN6288_c0_g1_i1.p1  ORF type:complete len:684 (-),score=67.92 TRINITY_DN6288_c0_g1_i1:50-2053(-)